MLSVIAFHSRPVRLGASVLVAALLVGLVAPHMAHAQVSGCTADPVVSLSNGTQLDLYASIDDSSQDVQQVTFNVTVPQGVHEVAYTPGLLGSKQVVNVDPGGGPRRGPARPGAGLPGAGAGLSGAATQPRAGGQAASGVAGHVLPPAGAWGARPGPGTV